MIVGRAPYLVPSLPANIAVVGSLPIYQYPAMQLKATVSPEEVREPEIFPVEAEPITFAQAMPEVASPPVQTYPFVDLGRFMICVETPAVPVHLNEPTTVPPVSAEVVAQPPVPVPSVNVVPPALN